MARHDDSPSEDLVDTIYAVSGAADRLADAIENEYRQVEVKLDEAVDMAAETISRHKFSTVALIAAAGFICGALWAKRA